MVKEILNQIANTRGRNDKISILVSNKDNLDLKTFFALALNPRICFFQKQVFTQKTVGNGSLLVAMSVLRDELSTRRVTGHAARDLVQSLIDNLSPEDASVICLILQKESGCDIGISTVNKIWPDMIAEWPNLLASPYSDKLAEKLNWSEGVFSQLKSDGGRVTVLVYPTGVEVYSRSGNQLMVFGEFDFLVPLFSGYALDGELLTRITSGVANRQTSNGIFNKCVRGTLSADEARQLMVMVWDMIPIDNFMAGLCSVPYKERFSNLSATLATITDPRIKCIPSKIVKSIQAAQDHFQEMLDLGEEGTMLKDGNIPWSDDRSKFILKLKSIVTADLKVTGAKEGKGEFAGTLGSLELTSECGLLECSMSGFSKKLRAQIWANLKNKPDTYVMVLDGIETKIEVQPGETTIGLNSIVEVSYNQLIRAKDSKIHSLFLPRFARERPDRTTANTLGEMR